MGIFDHVVCPANFNNKEKIFNKERTVERTVEL